MEIPDHIRKPRLNVDVGFRSLEYNPSKVESEKYTSGGMEIVFGKSFGGMQPKEIGGMQLEEKDRHQVLRTWVEILNISLNQRKGFPFGSVWQIHRSLEKFLQLPASIFYVLQTPALIKRCRGLPSIHCSTNAGAEDVVLRTSRFSENPCSVLDSRCPLFRS